LSSLIAAPTLPPTWQPVQENGSGAATTATGALAGRSAANAAPANPIIESNPAPTINATHYQPQFNMINQCQAFGMW
jgi:hypothetical protein